MTIIGRLLCSACTPPDRFIGLGLIPAQTDKFYDTDGRLVRTVTYPSESLSIPSVLQDCIGREHLFRLRCGHLHHGFMMSAQEWITLNGQRINGHSLVGEFA